MVDRSYPVLLFLIIFSGEFDLWFNYPTIISSWHPFLKWKLEDGYLVNLALNLALTTNSGTPSLAPKDSQTQKWSLDYNGNIDINQ